MCLSCLLTLSVSDSGCRSQSVCTHTHIHIHTQRVASDDIITTEFSMMSSDPVLFFHRSKVSRSVLLTRVIKMKTLTSRVFNLHKGDITLLSIITTVTIHILIHKILATIITNQCPQRAPPYLTTTTFYIMLLENLLCGKQNFEVTAC